jgi:hypothetical protein
VAVKHTVHLFERRALCLGKIEMDPHNSTGQEDGEKDVCSPCPCLQNL